MPGGEGPLLRLGLPAAPVHHPGGELQHEPVEAEHHRLPGEERGHTMLYWEERWVAASVPTSVVQLACLGVDHLSQHLREMFLGFFFGPE